MSCKYITCRRTARESSHCNNNSKAHTHLLVGIVEFGEYRSFEGLHMKKKLGVNTPRGWKQLVKTFSLESESKNQILSCNRVHPNLGTYLILPFWNRWWYFMVRMEDTCAACCILARMWIKEIWKEPMSALEWAKAMCTFWDLRSGVAFKAI